MHHTDLTDPMPAFLTVAVFAFFTALVVALHWGLRQYWLRVEAEQQRAEADRRREAAEAGAAMLERAMRQRAQADAGLLRRMG